MSTSAQGAGAGSQPPAEIQPSNAGLIPGASTTPVGSRNLGLSPENKPTQPTLELDHAAINQAAHALGMTNLNAGALRAMHTMGSMIKRVGAVKVGRSQMLIGQANAQSAINHCLQLVADVEDPALRLAALQVQSKLIASQIRGGYDMVRTAEIDVDEDGGGASKAPPFVVGQSVSVKGPTQINIGGAAGIQQPNPASPPQAPPPTGPSGTPILTV